MSLWIQTVLTSDKGFRINEKNFTACWEWTALTLSSSLLCEVQHISGLFWIQFEAALILTKNVESFEDGQHQQLPDKWSCSGSYLCRLASSYLVCSGYSPDLLLNNDKYSLENVL